MRVGQGKLDSSPHGAPDQLGRVDLTGFAALLGESLAAQVGLLEKLLHKAHFPSLGRYKERLLADTIRKYLPANVEVGTGFVLFPHSDRDPLVAPELYDPLNSSAFSCSRQCDIIIFDSARYPVVFRDGDFVVVRPEAVRAVVEVKGALSGVGLKESLKAFHDFATKWRLSQIFYQEHYQPTTAKPGMYLMAWDVQRDRSYRPRVTPKHLLKLIADYYSEHLHLGEADGYPLLNNLLLYNECEIGPLWRAGPEPDYTMDFGWRIADGRFVRSSSSGDFIRDKDRTIASLLADLHINVNYGDFN